ncbi:P-loop containing nucleoside triphosphate hydrolase protein [Xylaria arbuscula]|nr:P-loop containing nucleoside triphosphate hydrolase protein [Xylaria arbuscula]
MPAALALSPLIANCANSVFLYEIEYYQGILFLTTNCVRQFDDAFISRIHIVIHYPDLDEDDRGKIWNQFFDKLEDEREGALKVDKAAKRYIADKVLTLAEFRFLTRTHKEEGGIAVLEEKDFRQACDMTTEFHDHLSGVSRGKPRRL